ncbi:MAG: response regulator [SAR324 cluster bacterium]|nr:response regulator [SAR324 cluster bacterium]MBF0350457.1 response regulator [SAR324 cluster bacterium]
MKILLMDDERAIRLLFKVALEEEGYTVDTAVNGEEGFKLACKQHYDLIIMDMVMPGQGGLVTIPEIKKLDPTIKVLAMSGKAYSGGVLEAAIVRGADLTLTKPVEIPRLLSAINQLFPSIEQNQTPIIVDEEKTSQPAQILIVDDEKAIVNLFQNVLTGEGYGVDVTLDCEMALDMIQEKTYDLIIIDMVMPEGGGLTVIPEIIKISPETRIIATSGKSYAAGVMEAAKVIGADQVLSKPIEISTLLSTVKKTLLQEES